MRGDILFQKLAFTFIIFIDEQEAEMFEEIKVLAMNLKMNKERFSLSILLRFLP